MAVKALSWKPTQKAVLVSSLPLKTFCKGLIFVNIPHSYKVHRVCVLLSLCGCLNWEFGKFLIVGYPGSFALRKTRGFDFVKGVFHYGVKQDSVYISGEIIKTFSFSHFPGMCKLQVEMSALSFSLFQGTNSYA